MNGRKGIDYISRMTWYNGSSLVDHVLGSNELFVSLDLRVGDIRSLSDHYIVYPYLTLPSILITQGTPEVNIRKKEKHTIYRWNPQFKEEHYIPCI